MLTTLARCTYNKSRQVPQFRLTRVKRRLEDSNPIVLHITKSASISQMQVMIPLLSTIHLSPPRLNAPSAYAAVSSFRRYPGPGTAASRACSAVPARTEHRRLGAARVSFAALPQLGRRHVHQLTIHMLGCYLYRTQRIVSDGGFVMAVRKASLSEGCGWCR